jgi:hypothetical protein
VSILSHNIIDFDKLGREVNESVVRGEVLEPPFVKNHISAREMLRRIENGEFKGSFDYLGGFEQFKKDVESGMYD